MEIRGRDALRVAIIAGVCIAYACVKPTTTPALGLGVLCLVAWIGLLIDRYHRQLQGWTAAYDRVQACEAVRGTEFSGAFTTLPLYHRTLTWFLRDILISALAVILSVALAGLPLSSLTSVPELCLHLVLTIVVFAISLLLPMQSTLRTILVLAKAPEGTV